MTHHCPLCQSTNSICFDRRGRTPILLNRTYETQAAARAAATGALAFTGCQNCGFVWNAAFDENAIVYDGRYENDQAHSAVFRSHMADIGARALAMVPERERLNIVEVGAGQGVFLKAVADAAGAKLQSATGFDPAWRGKPGAGPAPVKLFAEMFDAATAERLAHRPNLVVSRHTIEHVANPLGFLRAIHDALPDGEINLAIETPCVQWIFDNWAIQDFFYEHCSLFTASSLRFALAQAGFESRSVSHVFGGQYLWAEANRQAARVVARPEATVTDFAAWLRRKDELVETWSAFIASARDKGPVYVWGAGAKGITFACMFDPDAKVLTGLVDINPNKQGAFAAMTGCPIMAPDAILGPRPTIIVMNPNYSDEVRRACSDRSLEAVISIYGPEGPT
ncbi:MAG: methyltransferase domain-containing protein [Alphaproteobacteria bacterium]|nr:methyltransferase domain-containing protein [Alphaproteobacteria bacterium]